MPHSFKTPAETVTGSGSFACLGAKARLHGTRALLVTGRRAMKAAGYADRALALLRTAGVDSTLFDDVRPEPTVKNVDDGRRLAKEASCNVVVGLGGGSAIDAAKTIAGLANEEAPTNEFHEGRLEATQATLPLIAVATTAGTGAEATPNAVITNPDRRLKRSIRGDSFLPRVAIADPELTLSCPPQLTAHAGMDALVQAIESYLSIHATPLSEALSLQAARLLMGALERAVKNGGDLPAREDCMYGSLMAGIALCNVRLGAVHGLAHPLGVRYGIPHGLTCAVLLPPVLRLNQPHAGQKFDELDRLAGGAIVSAVERLMDRIGVPRSFASYALRREDFLPMAEQSMQSGSTKANPKEMTLDDFVQLLEEVAG